jgi:hypothetical protein
MIKITAAQMEQVAKAYCVERTNQDGRPRDWRDQMEISQIMFAWYVAFSSVLTP